MTKTTVTVAVLILFLAVSAQARFSLNRAVDEGSDPLTVLPEPDSEPEPTLLLPSEPESTAVVAWEPETGAAGSSTGGDKSKPVTGVGFHPVKRAHKDPFSFRFGRSKKRAGRGGRVTRNRNSRSSAEGRKKAEGLFSHRPRQFPGRLMRLRNPGLKRQRNIHVDRHEKRHHRQEHVRHVRRGHEHVRHVQGHEHEHKRGGNGNGNGNGFVRKIRKFLMSF